ncbi:hypothetical protein [Plantactinospora sp. GCM10030261]|uniref:hypothetical protein n=1 Tax=Plantactinospora sp. GCM10030261 TaxID=3273420 RepID=UPI0036085654
MSTVPPVDPHRAAAARGGSARRRWLPVVLLLWFALLAGVGYLSARQDPPSVREQRSVGEAEPRVDRAAGALIAAAGPGVLAELGEARVDRGCRLSAVWDGAILTRTVTVRTGPDDDAARVLDLIADGLPAEYRAGTRPGGNGDGPRLRADAGEFVSVTGAVTAPGLIELTIATGCRPAEPPATGEELTIGAPVDGEPARILTALGLPAPEPDRQSRTVAPCPGTGATYTARATAPGTPTAGLAAALGPLATGGSVVVDTPELYGYRSDRYGVTARVVDGETRVTVTSGCPA